MYLQKVRSRKTLNPLSQRHGYAHPDPYQNVTDPQHWSTGQQVIYSHVLFKKFLSILFDSLSATGVLVLHTSPSSVVGWKFMWIN